METKIGDYRLYKLDASIEGRFQIWFTLYGEAWSNWFLQGETLDNTGKDIRQDLYIVESGDSIDEAMAKIKKEIEAK